MEELEQIRIDIEDLKNAYTNIVEAMNNLVDVDGLDDEYKELDRIAYIIDETRISLEAKEEMIKEEM